MQRKPADEAAGQPVVCGCCTTEPAEQSDATGCAAGQTVLTVEEQHILARIREIQQEAQHLKEAMRGPQSAGGEHPDRAKMERDLDALRRERTLLEDRRILAARERMRMLGHEAE
jgi:hypothetical protein